MSSDLHRVACQEYVADSGRGTGKEKVICLLLASPADILSKESNFVLQHLNSNGVATAIGLYFYRFMNEANPFIKIGECTRREGMCVRFRRGWHSTEKYADNYHRKKKKGVYVDSEFSLEIQKISSANPAYFVFLLRLL